MSIGKTNALFVATLPYPPGVRQCRIASEAADRSTLIECLSKKNDAQVVAYFALFFGTGMRPGELLGLEYSDLDLKERKVHVHQQTVGRRRSASTKTHMRRTLTIPAWVIPFISNLPSQFKYGHVFLNNLGTKCLYTGLFNQTWNAMFDDPKFRRDHSIRKRRPYTCQHSRAAELLTMGVRPAKATRQLGHSLEIFFRRYATYIESASDAIEVGKLNETGIETGIKINE
ncbi:Bbp50 [marine gamma proteobacterium HTCC2143]|uniref:Bbp50 n=1 Tax=marine gamma proteobacterium HTCC2143 TaxID=247633 RepID=A0YB42_9GAMM|nr:Bbp50 [marine gamma proteobacterium HTCC2143]